MKNAVQNMLTIRKSKTLKNVKAVSSAIKGNYIYSAFDKDHYELPFQNYY